MPAYISEVKYSSDESDFIEVGVTTGTDLSGHSVYVYRSDGSVEKGPLALGSVQSTNAGKDAYVVDPGEDTLDVGDAVALVDDMGTVVQFISFSGNTVTATAGPANGLTSTDIGASTGSTTLQSNDGGSTYTPAAQNEGYIPCYAPGTLIDTPGGPRAVGTLRVGDLVDTLDHGAMPIRWMRRGEQALDGVGRDGRPILIRAGAFGPLCPARDLVVSPQHRILVGGAGQLDGLFEGQCLAPAKALTGLPRIRPMLGKARITWVHFALDTHEVVRADGCLSESLLPGPMVLRGMTARQRNALAEIWRAPAAPGAALNGPTARDCLKPASVRRTLRQAGRRGGDALQAA